MKHGWVGMKNDRPNILFVKNRINLKTKLGLINLIDIINMNAAGQIYFYFIFILELEEKKTYSTINIRF